MQSDDASSSLRAPRLGSRLRAALCLVRPALCPAGWCTRLPTSPARPQPCATRHTSRKRTARTRCRARWPPGSPCASSARLHADGGETRRRAVSKRAWKEGRGKAWLQRTALIAGEAHLRAPPRHGQLHRRHLRRVQGRRCGGRGTGTRGKRVSASRRTSDEKAYRTRRRCCSRAARGPPRTRGSAAAACAAQHTTQLGACATHTAAAVRGDPAGREAAKRTCVLRASARGHMQQRQRSAAAAEPQRWQQHACNSLSTARELRPRCPALQVPYLLREMAALTQEEGPQLARRAPPADCGVRRAAGPSILQHRLSVSRMVCDAASSGARAPCSSSAPGRRSRRCTS